MTGTVPPGLRTDLQQLIEGEVSAEPEVLERYALDFGRIVRRIPAVVVRPRDAAEVARVVRYAHAQAVPVSSRGMGHSQRGQSLSHQGIVLDMRALAHIDDITPDAETFVSQPGALWSEVVAASTAQGLTPPVLTGYPYASVGGTHAAGGWGTASGRYGAQIDNCEALEVVTGTGELVRCDREHAPDLFHHVLGGMGQFGIMTRIQHRLRRYLPQTRRYILEYEDLGAFLEDNRRLAERHHADALDSTLHQRLEGKSVRWTGTIQVCVEAADLGDLDEGWHLSGLRFNRQLDSVDEPTSRFVAQAHIPEKSPQPGEAFPWMVTFLPWSRLQPFLEMCFSRVPPMALGGANGPIHVYPARQRVTQMPMLRVPDEPMMALLSICPTVRETSLPVVMALMSKLSDASLEAGGRRHLGTWVHFDQPRWRMQFGEAWPQINQVKHRYDPKGLLNPGFIDFD